MIPNGFSEDLITGNQKLADSSIC